MLQQQHGSLKSIACTIVSGFLGAGKTTLVRRLLQDAQRRGERVAFVSNELGALGIDKALLGGSGPAFVELADGCICCALSDDLRRTLLDIKSVVDPDRLLIEASGEAIPHDIQLILYQPDIAEWVTEESVISLVNAEQVVEGRDLEGAFSEQLDSADLILLNQIDRIQPPATLEAVQAAVASHSPDAPILPVLYANVDTQLLFGPLSANRPARTAPRAHRHTALVRAVVEVPAGLPSAVLEDRCWGDGVVRLKGIVDTAEGLCVVQGVGRRVEVLPIPAGTVIRDGILGKVVVIRRAHVGPGLARSQGGVTQANREG